MTTHDSKAAAHEGAHDAPTAAKPTAWVKVTLGAGGPQADVRVAADADAATAAKAAGYTEVPLADPVIEAYPKMLYDQDGAQRVVASEAEAKKLGGDWSDTPPQPKAATK